MARNTVTALLILSVIYLVTTISMWQGWLGVMQTNWAFNALFRNSAVADIRSEIVGVVVGSFIPSLVAFVATVQRWRRAAIVQLFSAVWVLIYLLLRVPTLQTMFRNSFLDFENGFSLWYRFHGFPAGTLVLVALLLMISIPSVFRIRSSGVRSE